MPWDRPEGSAIPNRQGDRSDVPIYTALGRALSAWEGVNVATGNLSRAFHWHLPEDRREQLAADFGRLLYVHDRAQMLRQTGAEFLADDFQDQRDIAAKLKKSLPKEMGAYTEWATRRNEIAHGYVTPASAPDYDDPQQPVRQFYSLLPSHARDHRWFDGEPEWNYLAREIEAFAVAFVELDLRIEKLAETVLSLQLVKRS